MLDPAVNGIDGPPFPGTLDGNTLTVADADAAGRLLIEAANSADVDGDAPVRDALTAFARRIRKMSTGGH